MGFVEQPTGEACVISPPSISTPTRSNFAAALKEAMHELRHTFGLGHWADPGCDTAVDSGDFDVTSRGDCLADVLVSARA